MDNKTIKESKLEDFLSSNKKLIRKTIISENLWDIVWVIGTLAAASSFLKNWVAGLFITAIAFIILGVIKQSCRKDYYGMIIKNSTKCFEEIGQYNVDDFKENLLTLDMFQEDCKYFSCGHQFLINSNNKIIDVHNLEVRNYARRHKRDVNYAIWEGQVIEMQLNKKFDHKMIITNSDVLKPLPFVVQDTSLVPFCKNLNVFVSDEKLFEEWKMPNLNELVKLISNDNSSFIIIISKDYIIVSIKNEGIHFLTPVYWTTTIKKSIIRDFNLLSKMVDIAKIVANFEIIEKNAEKCNF